MKVHKGDRFRALSDTEIVGIITFSAPITLSFKGMIPHGEILIAEEPNMSAKGCYLVPEQYSQFEKLFVPASDSARPEYGGYAIALSFSQLEASFEKID